MKILWESFLIGYGQFAPIFYLMSFLTLLLIVIVTLKMLLPLLIVFGLFFLFCIFMGIVHKLANP